MMWGGASRPKTLVGPVSEGSKGGGVQEENLKKGHYEWKPQNEAERGHGSGKDEGNGGAGLLTRSKSAQVRGRIRAWSVPQGATEMVQKVRKTG